MARCFAAAISQAAGLRGIPDAGHCSSADTSASCARSSAMPTSRTIRVRPAMTFADSIFQTVSMASCVSVAVTATDHTIIESVTARASALVLDLGAQALVGLAQLGRVFRTEVFGLEHLANLNLAFAFVRVRTPLHPL